MSARNPQSFTRPGRLAIAAVSIIAIAAGITAAPAAAAGGAAAFSVTSVAVPTNFAPGDASGNDTYVVTATDIGAQPTDGTRVTLTDTLPAGLTAQRISFFWQGPGAEARGAGGRDLGGLCNTTSVQCPFPLAMQPGDELEMVVHVTVDPSASGTVTNSASLSGGGTSPVSTSSQNQIGSTPAPFGIQAFSMTATGADGTPYTQAGGHPYALTSEIHFNSGLDQSGAPMPEENLRDVRVDLPPGLIADPAAVPRCSQADFSTSALTAGACPAATQIGVVTVHWVQASGAGPKVSQDAIFPVYNLVPPDNEPAQFGFYALATTFLDGGVRTGSDYGLFSTISNASQDGHPLLGATVTLWGVPADPSHNGQRLCQGTSQFGCASGVEPQAFLTMPTSCPGSPLSMTATADSWQHTGSFDSATSTGPATTGCDKLLFNPKITVQPDTTVADSPSGLAVDVSVPQDDDPNGVATADLKKAVVTLPQGVSVNPSAGNGLAACTPAQIGIDNANEPTCPDASKIGSVEVDTPLLPDPLKGSVYVAQQNNNPFGSLLAIYVTAEADGTLVKLAGHVIADPVTGQLQTIFDNNPQLPFTDFKLDFFGGPRGALATPESCGTYTSTADLQPWSAPDSGPDSVSSDSFPIDSGCVSGFSPSFTAGTQDAQAGAYSPFVLSFSRSDTDQDVSGLTVKLPEGMVAKLAGVAECTDAQLAAAAANTGAQERANPSCPAGSQVGTVQTGAGPGSDPMFLPGKAYLTGPYKGAPYGLAVVVPALAGPYDLGTVVVRQALYIDPTTAQVTAVSDPFPTILQGIPLRLRRVDVSLNRPDFTLNPTNCDPMAIGGTLTSTGGMTAPMSSRFQVGGCQDLGFTPKLKFALTGKGQTHSGQHPTLTATLTQEAGQANIQSAKVALPLSLALDTNNSSNVCNYDTAQAVHGGAVGCPANTIVGQATAVTPLLSQPLTGPVYLVQGIRFGPQGQRIHTLPSLLIPLRGQIALDLRAQSSVNGAQQLVTTFSTIPDAPVSQFTLQINGGSKGILVITGRGKSICGKAQVANANFGGQSGKQESQNPKLSTPACKGVTHHRRHKHK